MFRGMIIVLLSAVGISAFAASNLDTDIKKLRSLVDTGTNGGDVYIAKYDKEKFSYRDVLREIYKEIDESDCGFQVTVGRKSTIDKLDWFRSFRNSIEAQKLVSDWKKAGLLKGAASYYWNEENGLSENCLKEEVYLYLNDGRVVVIDYDSTT